MSMREREKKKIYIESNDFVCFREIMRGVSVYNSIQSKEYNLKIDLVLLFFFLHCYHSFTRSFIEIHSFDLTCVTAYHIGSVRIVHDNICRLLCHLNLFY